MIRINLLPQAKKQSAGSSASSGGTQVWLAVYLLASVVLCVVLGGVYYVVSSTLAEKVALNRDLSRRIADAQRQSSQMDEVRAAIQQSQDLERVVSELQRARLGPTRVLMELSRILSEGGGPTIDPQRFEEERRRNPLAGFNPGWDTRRLWLTSFKEEDRECKIEGLGKTNEDVAEFLRRLTLSDSFEMVNLDETRATDDAESGVQVISFKLSCKVRY